MLQQLLGLSNGDFTAQQFIFIEAIIVGQLGANPLVVIGELGIDGVVEVFSRGEVKVKHFPQPHNVLQAVLFDH